MRILSVAAILAVAMLAGCAGDQAEAPTDDTSGMDETGFKPHVIVGVPDSGINPYHQLYFREELTMHPCTYIQDFPCDIPALELTLDAKSWGEAFEADRAKWSAIEPGDVFWIPQTVFVAVVCDYAYRAGNGDLCIIDDSHMHGTGTTSSVIMENPDALIAFKEGGSDITPIMEKGIPVDIYSVSWGYIVPIPVGGELLGNTFSPIYVKAAGNDPRPGHSDSWTGSPYVISVGGAYAASGSEEAMATKQPDIVSYYCRPTAQTKSLDEMRESYCGTSFAAPTAAGALSKVVLALRQESGYLGSVAGGKVDPALDISVADLRNALNRTASYDPEPQYPNSRQTSIPLNPVAPWVQWGWGFYDGLVANATIDHFLVEAAPEKPAAAVAYMETLYDLRRTLHG